MSGVLLAAALAYDLVTHECHPTGKFDHGAPAMACEDRIWLVGMSLAQCEDSRKRIKKQVRGEVADSLVFHCVPEDDE